MYSGRSFHRQSGGEVSTPPKKLQKRGSMSSQVPTITKEKLKELTELPLFQTYEDQPLTNCYTDEVQSILAEKVEGSDNAVQNLLAKVIIHHRIVSESIPPNAPTPLKSFTQQRCSDFRHIPYTPMELVRSATTEDGEPIFLVLSSSNYNRTYICLQSDLPTYSEVFASMDEDLAASLSIYSLSDYIEHLIGEVESSPYSNLGDAWRSKLGKEQRAKKQQEQIGK